MSPLRRLSITAGLALIAIAFAAATRVENSRQGLIAEVILYLAAATGLVLLFYGLFARPRPSTSVGSPTNEVRAQQPKVPTANDLVLGTAGIILGVVLFSGLAISGGISWALLALVLLSPMIGGSLYLIMRFIRAPIRDWRVDPRALRGAANQRKHSERDQRSRPDQAPVDQPQVAGENQGANDDQDQPQGH